MDCWSQYYMLTIITFLIIVIAETSHIRTIDVHQDERIRLECIVTSKLDAEEVRMCRISFFSVKCICFVFTSYRW